jgi:methylenetetrahydrofolate dehydrogenase (NADP+)/methenyltetrahydrofolate cyclohydrolase
MAKILDGVATAEQIRAEVAEGVKKLQSSKGVTPGLAVVLVGDDPASAVYVRNKGLACEKAGIFSQTVLMPKEATQQEVIDQVRKLNKDDRFHGILVQLPLPRQINEPDVLLEINPDKDADGLHPVNMGRLITTGETPFIPCTPHGVQQLLVRNGFDPAGKRVVICGRSEIVGKPLALLLMQKKPGANATVTVCHTGTKDMPSVTRQAEILVAAMGRAEAIKADMVSEGVVVVDVGTNRVDDPTAKRGFRLVGDVDFAGVSKKAAAISPVPGGVGPMTIAMLLVNTLKSAELTAARKGRR